MKIWKYRHIQLLGLSLLISLTSHVQAAEPQLGSGLTQGFGLGFGTGLNSDYSSLRFTALPDDSKSLLSVGNTSSSVSGTVNCGNESQPNGTKSVAKLNFQMRKVNSFLTSNHCEEAKKGSVSAFKFERFSTKRCNAAFLCASSRMSDRSEDDNGILSSKIREIAAKDLAKNLVKMKSDEMEKLETLKRFAQKKYGNKIGKSCEARFEAAKGSSCQLDVLENAFKENQVNCTQGFGCYNSDDQGKQKYSYKVFEEKFDKSSNKSAMLSFFEGRVDWKTGRHLEQDKHFLETLSDLVTSAEFINASSANKEVLFVEALKSSGGQKYADPVLSMDFDLEENDLNKFKEKPHYNGLKNIFSKKGITKNDFLAQFEAYRKKRAEVLLDSKENACDKTPTISSICLDVTKLSKGEKNRYMSSLTLGNLISSKTIDPNSEEYKKINALTGNKIKGADDMEVFFDAERCLSFNLVDLFSGDRLATKPSDPLYDPYSFNSGRDSFNDIFLATGGSSTSDSSYGKDIGPVNMDETMKSLGLANGSNSELEKIEGLNQAEVNKAPVQPSDDSYNTANNNFFNPNAYNNNNNHFDNKNFPDEVVPAAKENHAGSEVKVETPDQQASNAKLDELMKKLSSTEDKLEKLKASTEAAEENRAKEKKIQEENAVIADLKNQINDLKTKSAKATVINTPASSVTVENKPVAAAPAANNNFSVSSSRPAETKAHQESFDQSRTKAESSAASAAAGAASAASRSIASTPVLTSVDSGNGGANSLILTKVDGMTSEKAAETITSRILELNGVPFLIEEDGVTKKVIPLIKDGKVDLDEKGLPKYVKIKVNKKECTDEEKSKGKCRAPAMVAKVNTAVADEKRDQEEKLRREIERAQYMKLKALTDKALNKK